MSSLDKSFTAPPAAAYLLSPGDGVDEEGRRPSLGNVHYWRLGKDPEDQDTDETDPPDDTVVRVHAKEPRQVEDIGASDWAPKEADLKVDAYDRSNVEELEDLQLRTTSVRYASDLDPQVVLPCRIGASRQGEATEPLRNQSSASTKGGEDLAPQGDEIASPRTRCAPTHSTQAPRALGDATTLLPTSFVPAQCARKRSTAIQRLREAEFYDADAYMDALSDEDRVEDERVSNVSSGERVHNVRSGGAKPVIAI